MPVEAWDQVMSVNLRGTFLCTQAFGRLRRDMTGGAIVNLASAAGFSARIGASHYSASKAGVVMFTKAAALELGPLGIRVNAVAPGLIEVRDDQVSMAYRDQYLISSRPKAGDLSRTSKAVIYDVLFKASSNTMQTIAADPKHLGANVGITAVLHTWGSAMTQNPHSRYRALSSP